MFTFKEFIKELWMDDDSHKPGTKVKIHSPGDEHHGKIGKVLRHTSNWYAVDVGNNKISHYNKNELVKESDIEQLASINKLNHGNTGRFVQNVMSEGKTKNKNLYRTKTIYTNTGPIKIPIGGFPEKSLAGLAFNHLLKKSKTKSVKEEISPADKGIAASKRDTLQQYKNILNKYGYIDSSSNNWKGEDDDGSVYTHKTNQHTVNIYPGGWSHKGKNKKLVATVGNSPESLERHLKVVSNRLNKKSNWKDSIYRDLGMKKVKGTLGGTYYENELEETFFHNSKDYHKKGHIIEVPVSNGKKIRMRVLEDPEKIKDGYRHKVQVENEIKESSENTNISINKSEKEKSLERQRKQKERVFNQWESMRKRWRKYKLSKLKK